MLKVGITGNIGAGKSQVCHIFELLDVPVYYADPRARQLMTQNKELAESIRQLLGKNAYQEDGSLNRKYISGMVFTDREKLERLNGLVHPAVRIDFIDWCAKNSLQRYVIKEAALLFEAKSYLELDYTVLVVANESIRLKRVMERDGADEQQVRDRMNNQMPEEKKRKLADFMIENNGESSLVGQVLRLHRQFLLPVSPDRSK